MSEEGTITPEVQIGQLEEALATETDRLKKLFAAYETQEKELVDARAEIEVLEKEVKIERLFVVMYRQSIYTHRV